MSDVDHRAPSQEALDTCTKVQLPMLADQFSVEAVGDRHLNIIHNIIG